MPWTICPECGRGPGEDHRTECSGRHPPPVNDYSKLPRVREGRSAADYGIVAPPLVPLDNS